MGGFSSFNVLGSLATGIPLPNNSSGNRTAVGGSAGDISVSQKDVLLGRDSTGGGPAQEIPCTAQARALLDDSTAAAQRSTIGIPDSGQWVTFANLSDVDLTGLADGDALVYDSASAIWKPGCRFAAAEIYCSGASTAQSIATGATYVKVTAFTDNGASAGATSDAANDKITITKTGVYRVEGSFSFTSGTNNVTAFGTAFLDGVEQNQIHFARKIGTGADVGNAGFTGFIDVTSVPVDLDFRVRHDYGSAVDFTFSYANLNISLVGPT